MGKIIVIESGTDGSGKQTQTECLYNRLKKEGKKVVQFSFPQYGNKSATFVEMYLNGEFGTDPESISPYVTSVFFAMDRYATFYKKIKRYYEEDYLILLDRYTTSNMTYQASKISGLAERDKFLEWLYDFEFNILKLPKPDVVFFLDLPVDNAQYLIRDRKNKIDNQTEKDIHEKNVEYLKKTYYNAKYVSKKFKWKEIKCLDGVKFRTIEDIHEEIYEKLKKI